MWPRRGKLRSSRYVTFRTVKCPKYVTKFGQVNFASSMSISHRSDRITQECSLIKYTWCDRHHCSVRDLIITRSPWRLDIRTRISTSGLGTVDVWSPSDYMDVWSPSDYRTLAGYFTLHDIDVGPTNGQCQCSTSNTLQRVI